MPTYEFRDKTTGRTWEEFTTLAGREEILSDPNVEQVVFAPAFVSGVMGITHKTDDGFKEVLSKAAEAHPLSPLADRVGRPSTKEIKTRRVWNKHNK